MFFRESMKLMLPVWMHVQQVDIQMVPIFAWIVQMNVSFVKLLLNVQFAEKLSPFLLEIKNGSTTLTLNVRKHALIAIIKIL